MPLLDTVGRRALLHRARAAIARAIGAESAVSVAEPIPNRETLVPADLRAGAFVTLRMAGELRGCIGYPEPTLPLLEAVERCAVSAALADPRFPPLSASEWTGVHLEISVLGPIEPVRDIAEVEIGRHGLIVEFGSRRGLLLPQVAIEWQWDAAEFVSQTCVKAGLPRDAWRNGARWYRFEAEVFGESD